MLKRTFDILISAFFLFTFSPFSLLIALLIKLDSPGPVFHRAQRIGKDGKPFILYKFRTPGLSSVEGMVADAPNRGPGITGGTDPRITRVGCFLRKLKIDEMPQLINVLQASP
jgi:lipopolysaccharide/colanic/teichoic acid biosynthesis glycosyltransferase